MTTIAKAYLEAQVAEMAAEAIIDDALYALLGDDADFEWTADYYDGSIELYGLADWATAETASGLLGMGFSRCWIHPHDRGDCPNRDPGRLLGECKALYRAAKK